MSAFDRDIIMPAIRLAKTLRQSTANYHFVFRVASNKHEEKRPALRKPGNRLLLYKSDLEDIDVLDVGSKITLKKGRHLRGGERREHRGQYTGGAPGAVPRERHRKHHGEQTARAGGIVRSRRSAGARRGMWRGAGACLISWASSSLRRMRSASLVRALNRTSEHRHYGTLMLCSLGYQSHSLRERQTLGE